MKWPYRCPKCGQAYKNVGSLAKHLNRHREERELNRKVAPHRILNSGDGRETGGKEA